MQPTHDPPLQLTELFCGSLFSGIGGMDLGLERAGFELKWQVEIDPYCRRVLERHWPTVRRWDDVRTWPQPDTERVDLVFGGFPCQDVSNAGKRVGIEGERSGLWFEFARVIRELRPRFVLVENVPALLIRDRGMGAVLGELAECGYDAEWDCVGADFMGSTQHRERVWILAYANDAGLQGPIWAGQQGEAWPSWETARCESVRSDRGPWPPGPRAVSAIPRMADGPTHRMERLRGIGNAVVPQVAEWIGRRIIAAVS